MRVDATALSHALHVDISKHIDVQLPSWAPDSTPTEVACYILRDSLLKKYTETGEPTQAACDAARTKFLAVNERCKGWSIPYEFASDEELVQGVKQSLHDFWYQTGGPYISDYREIFLRGRAGPGASIGARDCDFYTKMFDSTLTATGDLPQVWERLTSMTGLWSEASRFRDELHGVKVVESSKYSFVNKSTKIARGICTEPSINMWMQLGCGSLLTDAIRSFYGISLSNQPDKNRVLARLGSIHDDLTTIDLESASDSLGLNVLRELLPRTMFSTLCSFRCPSTTMPNGERVVLNMISTMGNGFTFPLQTIVFSAIVHSAYVYAGLRSRGSLLRTRDRVADYGVFGDDIIVRRSATRLVLRLLYLLGFTVNTDKTFVEGRFRESCGADYIDGKNVRGVYIASLNTRQDLYASINNLTYWTAKTGVSLPYSTTHLVKHVRRPHRRFVPPDEGMSAGIHVPEAYALAANYGRNRRGLTHYTADRPRDNSFWILGGVCWTYRTQVRRNYNPAGLLLSFLAGSIRGYQVTLRHRETKYTTRQFVTPRWDYVPPRPAEDLSGPTACERFVNACDRNLVGCGFGAGGR